ncbi:CBS domain-containing protein [Halorubellus sp. JP-L1]|uniref:CBS domain-containing protein n=1 Tax=Halorubellus sp. JP-L1 TaxID=2715753 RepID=UPI00140A799F|nr:CBS domain-containing protein [Halorubellus sp. JP-L1]NHN40565.1 CBS domain-containing protein [Halorubellus sp. JP-L1]
MNADVSIRDVAARNFVGVTETDSVSGAAKLMYDDDASSAVVLRGSEPVGIVTERDVVGLVAEDGDPTNTEVSVIMSDPVVTVDAAESLDVAADRMGSETIRHLVVTDDDELFGVLSANDVLGARAAGSPTGSKSGTEPTAGDLIQNGGMELVDDRSTPGADATYDPQSICEVCGALSDSLTDRNGQLVCDNCVDV